MRIIKRSGAEVDFDISKIIFAKKYYPIMKK